MGVLCIGAGGGTWKGSLMKLGQFLLREGLEDPCLFPLEPPKTNTDVRAKLQVLHKLIRVI